MAEKRLTSGQPIGILTLGQNLHPQQDVTKHMRTSWWCQMMADPNVILRKSIKRDQVQMTMIDANQIMQSQGWETEGWTNCLDYTGMTWITELSQVHKTQDSWIITMVCHVLFSKANWSRRVIAYRSAVLVLQNSPRISDTLYMWHYSQVGITDRWPLHTGRHCIQVGIAYKWALHTSGHYTQMGIILRWAVLSLGNDVQVLLTLLWL